MAIKLSNINFSYADSTQKAILNIPTWALATGEKVFIHGASGTGKSTLLNVLSGLLIPNSGQVHIFDKRIDQMKSRQRDKFRANHIGYVFQQFNLIPYLSAIDNIRLAQQFFNTAGVAASKKNTGQIESLLSRLNIAEQDWHKPARQLSIGQQQRVAIARALINQPKLLIADEPTSSLDEANKLAFMTLLMQLLEEQNTSVVFVSHDMSLSSYFDRIEALSDINQVGDGQYVS